MKTYCKSLLEPEYVFFFLILIFISPVLSTAAIRVSIKDIRYQSFEGHTRVTVFLSGPVDFSMNHLSKPERLYFDLKDTTISKKIKTNINVGDGILKAVRARQFSKDTVRIVFDIERAEDFKASLVNKKNPKLIIDIYAAKLKAKEPEAVQRKQPETAVLPSAQPKEDSTIPAKKESIKPDVLPQPVLKKLDVPQPKEPSLTAPALTKPEDAARIKEEFINIIASGEKYIQSGDYDKALIEFKKADKMIPGSPEPHVFMGRFFLKLNKIDEAIKNYKEAIEHDPNSADAYNGLGYSYYAQGKPGSAIDAFQTAIKLNPDHDDAHAGLGYTYLTVGDTDSAMQQYRILKGLGSYKADELFRLIFKAQTGEQTKELK